MNKEEALSRAADWWTDMTFSGHWDNGDKPTELLNSIVREMSPGPEPKDASNLRKAFLDVLQKSNDVYNDYGNSLIDSAFKEHKLSYSSSVHCPQKAGTRIFEQNGEWFVEAKTGYGKPYERI